MRVVSSLTGAWRDSFESLLKSVETDLVLCSPFISRGGTEFVGRCLPAPFRDRGRLTVITNLSADNIAAASTDPVAVRGLTELVRSATTIHLPGLHANIYVADVGRAIVTSGNLTTGGIARNYECGIEATDPAVVACIRGEADSLGRCGSLVPDHSLKEYCDIAADCVPGIADRRKQFESEIKGEVGRRVSAVEAGLRAPQLTDEPLHTVLARTVARLLHIHGPTSTVDLHELVRSEHPDLCDMDAERVINGRRFGKKWKHAVRTSQQRLKKQGVVEYVEGLWRLVAQPQ